MSSHRAVPLTGDPVLDALAPLVVDLGRAVGHGDARKVALLRSHARDVLLVHDRDPADAGWVMAVIAAAMLPLGAPPPVLLAWLRDPPRGHPGLPALTTARLSARH